MKIERKSIICSLKPTASPDQPPPFTSPPTSQRRGIRRQATAYEPAAENQQTTQPLKSGWSSNPNLTMDNQIGNSGNKANANCQFANLTKRVKLAKATKVGRWTSVQSGH